jgi:hypothetical protein
VEAKAQIAAATVWALFLNATAEIQVLSSSQFSYCGVLKVVSPTPKRYSHRESHPTFCSDFWQKEESPEE